jgi:hypothetical protein
MYLIVHHLREREREVKGSTSLDLQDGQLPIVTFEERIEKIRRSTERHRITS